MIRGLSSIRFYDARAGSEYYGVPVSYVAPQVKVDEILGNYGGGSDAYTIPGTRVVVLTTDFFGTNVNRLTIPEMVLFQWEQINTLFHETIHAISGLDDSHIFSNQVFLDSGLSNGAWNASGHRNTMEITQWLERGCKKE